VTNAHTKATFIKKITITHKILSVAKKYNMLMQDSHDKRLFYATT